jgi:hypothetical protein
MLRLTWRRPGEPLAPNRRARVALVEQRPCLAVGQLLPQGPGGYSLCCKPRAWSTGVTPSMKSTNDPGVV